MLSMQSRLAAIFAVLCCLSAQTLGQVNLGTAAAFGVLASSAITNTGNTVIDGELGIYPGTASSITGFGPGTSGDVHAGDGVADQALQDAKTAYDTASGLDPSTDITGQDLGGQTLVAGTYSSSTVGITGPLVLDGQNDPNSLFVFQIGSTLITGTGSSVVLINGAKACNVFWAVGSSATLGTTSTFVGNILALSSISLGNNVTDAGGLYALTGAVTLINDRVTAQQACGQVEASSSATTLPSSTPTPTPSTSFPISSASTDASTTPYVSTPPTDTLTSSTCSDTLVDTSSSTRSFATPTPVPSSLPPYGYPPGPSNRTSTRPRITSSSTSCTESLQPTQPSSISSLESSSTISSFTSTSANCSVISTNSTTTSQGSPSTIALPTAASTSSEISSSSSNFTSAALNATTAVNTLTTAVSTTLAVSTTAAAVATTTIYGTACTTTKETIVPFTPIPGPSINGTGSLIVVVGTTLESKTGTQTTGAAPVQQTTNGVTGMRTVQGWVLMVGLMGSFLATSCFW